MTGSSAEDSFVVIEAGQVRTMQWKIWLESILTIAGGGRCRGGSSGASDASWRRLHLVQTGAVNFEKMSDEISPTSNYLTIAMRKRGRRTIIIETKIFIAVGLPSKADPAHGF